MTTYTYSQLESLWIQAGGPSATAPIAAAIALAESSGNSDALNLTDNNGTQTSVGLWQVSNGTHQYPSSWLTPQGNAAEAVAKYNAAGGWSPWGTYNSGAYRTFLQSGVSPATSLPAGNRGSNGTGTATGGSSSASTPAANVPTNIGGALSGATGLLRDVATMLDYVFGMFGRGQGWRLMFTLISAVALFGSYKALVAAGAVPAGFVPSPSRML